MLGAQRLPGLGQELLRPLERPRHGGLAEEVLKDGVHERPAHSHRIGRLREAVDRAEAVEQGQVRKSDARLGESAVRTSTASMTMTHRRPAPTNGGPATVGAWHWCRWVGSPARRSTPDSSLLIMPAHFWP